MAEVHHSDPCPDCGTPTHVVRWRGDESPEGRALHVHATCFACLQRRLDALEAGGLPAGPGALRGPDDAPSESAGLGQRVDALATDLERRQAALEAHIGYVITPATADLLDGLAARLKAIEGLLAAAGGGPPLAASADLEKAVADLGRRLDRFAQGFEQRLLLVESQGKPAATPDLERRLEALERQGASGRGHRR